jgi:hypothetical protein
MKIAIPSLVLILLFSGCAGGNKADDVDLLPPVTESPAANTTAEQPVDEFVPKFHTHDYWSGRDKLNLFGPFDVELGSDAMQETFYENDKLILGRIDFDTKTDGEQINLADATDVVFQGTSKILVTIKWTDTNNVPGLRFYFKHAGTPIFTLLGPVTSGETYEIPLKQGWADMPHQLSLSRWKFRLEAYNPATGSYPIQPHASRGKVNVEMSIINGGEQFIDPPHPYFFQNGPVRYAGEVNATLNNCVVVNNTRPGGNSLPVGAVAFSCSQARGPLDYKVDGTHIVPWETTKMLVTLYWNETAQNAAAPKPGIKLGLLFHGGDSDKYRYPKAVSSTANSATYEIGVSEAMSDSPYAQQSDWRYGVYPITQDQRDYGGSFSGAIHIATFAVKEGDTAGRGMGN